MDSTRFFADSRITYFDRFHQMKTQIFDDRMIETKKNGTNKQSFQGHQMSGMIAFARKLVHKHRHTHTTLERPLSSFMWAWLIPWISDEMKNIARLCYLSIHRSLTNKSDNFYELRGSCTVCAVVCSRSAKWHCPLEYITLYIWFCSFLFHTYSSKSNRRFREKLLLTTLLFIIVYANRKSIATSRCLKSHVYCGVIMCEFYRRIKIVLSICINDLARKRFHSCFFLADNILFVPL